MSKSRRLFLSIQSDDDFWGNGDRIEEKKVSSIGKCRDMDDDNVDEMEDKYYFKQSKLGRQRLQHLHEKEEKKMFEESEWKLRVRLEETNSMGKREDSVKEIGETGRKMIDMGMEKNKKNEMSIDPDKEFYNNYRNYFGGRPEVMFLIRSMDENAIEKYEKSFIDLYDRTRKRLEMYPNSDLDQVLRSTYSSNTNNSSSDLPNKNAIVVSNFREPDRRLGRYSKYYYHHNVGPEVYSRKVFVGGLPACVREMEMLNFFSRYGRLQVDWPSKNFGCKSDSDPSICNEAISSPSFQPSSHLGMASPPFGQINPFANDFQAQPESQSSFRNVIGSGGAFLNPGMISNYHRNVIFGGGRSKSTGEGINGEKNHHHFGYVFLLFEKERSVRELVSDCFEEEEGLFITLENSLDPIRVQIRPWLLADAEFLMDFNVPINTKLVAFIGGIPRPLKAVELAHFFEQTYGNVVCVGIDIDNKFKYPRGSGRVAFSSYDAYVQAITDRYIVLDHEDIHKRVEIKPYFFHNQSCEECSGRYNRQYAPFFCPSLECFQYYCEPCWHKMHSQPSRFHHMPVIKGI